MHKAIKAIGVEGLVKRFGSVTAVDGISFSVKQGEIFGILGDNGAGKSTLVKQMVNLLGSDQGTIELFGRSINTDPGFVTVQTIGLSHAIEAQTLGRNRRTVPTGPLRPNLPLRPDIS